jgi:hypothetical protein
MRRAILSSLLAGSVLTSGCGFHAEPLLIGSVGGAAAGAGTGAIIGAVIANGDIAASALLGGAIGIPVGLAIAALIDMNSERTVREIKADEIEANQREIFARQREIDALREKLRLDETGLGVSDETRAYIYDGHTYGNSRR